MKAMQKTKLNVGLLGVAGGGGSRGGSGGVAGDAPSQLNLCYKRQYTGLNPRYPTQIKT